MPMKRCKNDGEKMQKRYLTEHILRKKNSPSHFGSGFFMQTPKMPQCHFHHYGGTYDGFSVVVLYDFVICASLFFTI